MESVANGLQDKVCVITGSNSGIGKAAALKMAMQGAIVILACRSPQRGKIAQAEIIKLSDNSRVDLMVVDLSSQASIRHFVDEFKAKHNRLDVLVNNAANFDLGMKEVALTEDGIETIFATNHLGPFLMTNLLIDVLKTSAPARIINVSSKGLLSYPLLTIDFDNLNSTQRRKFRPARAYYHSKLAHVMFTYEFARRLEGSGVTSNCIRVPTVAVDMTRYSYMPQILQRMYRAKTRFSISPEQMAETYLYLAMSPEVANVSGKCFDEKNRIVKSSKKSLDKIVWAKLWDASVQLTGLSSN